MTGWLELLHCIQKVLGSSLNPPWLLSLQFLIIFSPFTQMLGCLKLYDCFHLYHFQFITLQSSLSRYYTKNVGQQSHVCTTVISNDDSENKLEKLQIKCAFNTKQQYIMLYLKCTITTASVKYQF